MTREIPLTQGQVALVDDEDYDLVSQYSWYASFNPSMNGYYAVAHISASGSRKICGMHRLLMNAPSSLCVDHINHNTLDNTRNNLRLCTKGQNQANQKLHGNNTSGYKGVNWHSKARIWCANLRIGSRKIYLGSYDSPLLAAIAYDNAAKKMCGEFALTNQQLGLLNTSEQLEVGK